MKILRLVKYYKKTGRLSKTWKYSPANAKVIVSGGK
jgi:ribosomal protein S15P/S13E